MLPELEEKLTAGLVGLVRKSEELFEEFPESVRRRQLSVVCWGLVDRALAAAREEFGDISSAELAEYDERLGKILREKFFECAGFHIVPREVLSSEDPSSS